MTRRQRGEIAYYNGLRAEDVVARDFGRRGMAVLAQRWRGRAGELDMIVRSPEGLIVVEVKTGPSCAEAALLLRPAQMRRIWQAAEEYLASQPLGFGTPCRIDVALVDRHGTIEYIENAVMAA